MQLRPAGRPARRSTGGVGARIGIGITGALIGSGALTVAYAAPVERVPWIISRIDVPVLAPGSRPLSVLHISDLHMTAGQRSKQEWVRSLADLEPDLVITTGDNLAATDAVAPTLRALEPLLRRPGAFVFGSNDYFAPVFKNPARYLLPADATRLLPPGRLPWRDLREDFTGAGWLDADNRTGTVLAGDRRIAVAGVDDPHIHRDRYGEIAGPADRGADLRLGLTHSPEPHILDDFADDGYDLVLAGHTHCGQLRVPFYGALVTNCGIDRGRCRGLSRWGPLWLNVSAGLGTSPYAPVRFACPPEATLLTLLARPTGAAAW
ncbi:MAG: metallophosphoesterase [Mycobacteriales bacterium]